MTGSPILSATGIAKRYRGKAVLQALDFTLCAGEIAAIIGENGGGKSTLLSILAGFIRADAGSVSRAGTCGYSPQSEWLYPYLTPDEHFRLFGAAANLPRELVRTRAWELYEALHFGAFHAAPVCELSGGTRQKLNLALSLLGDPAILLLDEPYHGFDAGSYERFWPPLERARRQGKGVVLVSHLVLERSRFDRLLVLREGRLHEHA